jgi:predicted Zn-dependent peptidase
MYFYLFFLLNIIYLWETAMQSNAYIAGSYASSVLPDRPLSRLDNLPRDYNAVTLADIQKICAWLLPKGPAQVVLYPETN